MPPADPPRPRLVATDLDGTLLRSDGSVSPRTRAALSDAEVAGVEVVFVTARPPRWLAPLADAVGGHGVVLAGNGAFVVDVRSGVVLAEEGFGSAALAAVTADLRAEWPHVGLAVERSTGMVLEPGFVSPHGEDHRDGVLVERLERLADLDAIPVGKLLAVVPGATGPAFLARVDEVVGERGVVAYSGVDFLAEISPAGVSKAAGLARWCAARGIAAEDVWAFGDMPNDLPMLGWAGTAYAVANAHPDVLDAATHICPANDDDGVARVLEEVLAR